VRCSECAAEMPPLREFCPNCGTPTQPGLRRRDPAGSSGRSPEELKRNRKTVLIACAAIAGVLGVAGRLNFPIPPVHFSLHERSKGPAVTDADDLARAYSQDPAKAQKRFGGREIVVTGEFLRIVPDGYGSIDMRLNTTDPNFPLGVDVSNASVDDAKLLRPGQQVTVSCRRVAGSGNDRWLQDCAIQREFDIQASRPTAPTPPARPPSSPPAPPLPPTN
jgi:hypothetical protein